MAAGSIDARLTTLISAEPLTVAAAEQAVVGPQAGAVVTFCGVVRDHDHGRQVVALDYVSHPSAEQVLAAVVARVSGPALESGAVEGVYAAHRIGELTVGDLAFLVVVAAAHRGPAFALCSALVDEVKRDLPIWKRQQFTDGTDEWVACP